MRTCGQCEHFRSGKGCEVSVPQWGMTSLYWVAATVIEATECDQCECYENLCRLQDFVVEKESGDEQSETPDV